VNDSLRTIGLPVISAPMAFGVAGHDVNTPRGTPARSASTPARAPRAAWLSRFDDDRAARGERRADLAGDHRGREVPRRDGAHTPIGCLSTTMRWSRAGVGITSPSMRLASSANHSRNDAAYWISPLASASGLPCSVVRIERQIVGVLEHQVVPAAQDHWRVASRCVARQAGQAALAVSMARRVSARPMRGTVAIVLRRWRGSSRGRWRRRRRLAIRPRCRRRSSAGRVFQAQVVMVSLGS
jgi:hypothetical protein